MDPVQPGVRLACLVLLSTKSSRDMRLLAEEVLRSAAGNSPEYSALNLAYVTMTTRQKEVGIAGKAFETLTQVHGSPLWSGTINEAYSKGRAEASAAYDHAKIALDEAKLEFTARATALSFVEDDF